jgi:cephalosporin hydroxylase
VALAAWSRSAGRVVARVFHLDLVYRTGTFASVSWLRAPVWQSVLDLWTIQETISELRPALLVETGTHRGGSALFYAHLMELLGTGRVITIDIEDYPERVDHPRVTFLHGSSTARG